MSSIVRNFGNLPFPYDGAYSELLHIYYQKTSKSQNSSQKSNPDPNETFVFEKLYNFEVSFEIKSCPLTLRNLGFFEFAEKFGEIEIYTSYIKGINEILEKSGANLVCRNVSRYINNTSFCSLPDLVVSQKNGNLKDDVINVDDRFIIELKKVNFANAHHGQLIREMEEFFNHFNERYMVIGILMNLNKFCVYCGFRCGVKNILYCKLTDVISYDWNSIIDEGMKNLVGLLLTDFCWYGSMSLLKENCGKFRCLSTYLPQIKKFPLEEEEKKEELLKRDEKNDRNILGLKEAINTLNDIITDLQQRSTTLSQYRLSAVVPIHMNTPFTVVPLGNKANNPHDSSLLFAFAWVFWGHFLLSIKLQRLMKREVLLCEFACVLSCCENLDQVNNLITEIGIQKYKRERYVNKRTNKKMAEGVEKQKTGIPMKSKMIDREKEKKKELSNLNKEKNGRKFKRKREEKETKNESEEESEEEKKLEKEYLLGEGKKRSRNEEDDIDVKFLNTQWGVKALGSDLYECLLNCKLWQEVPEPLKERINTHASSSTKSSSSFSPSFQMYVNVDMNGKKVVVKNEGSVRFLIGEKSFLNIPRVEEDPMLLLPSISSSEIEIGIDHTSIPSIFSLFLSEQENAAKTVTLLVEEFVGHVEMFIPVMEGASQMMSKLFKNGATAPKESVPITFMWQWLSGFDTWRNAFTASPIYMKLSNYVIPSPDLSSKQICDWLLAYLMNDCLSLCGREITKKDVVTFLAEKKSWGKVFLNLEDLLGKGDPSLITMKRCECLGSGASSEVVRYEIDELKMEVAVKFFFSRSKDFENELKMYKVLKESQITSLDVVMVDIEKAIIFFTPVLKEKFVLLKISKKMLLEFVDYLKKLKDANLVHRDIREDNIMIMGEGENRAIILIDWGKGRMGKDKDPSKIAGSIIYASSFVLDTLIKGDLDHSYEPRDDLSSFLRLLLAHKSTDLTNGLKSLAGDLKDLASKVKKLWDEAFHCNPPWKDLIDQTERGDYAVVEKFINENYYI
jgi:hypothetical protein